MTPALELLDGSTLVISPTQLEILKTCSAMWRYRYLYRRVANYDNAAATGGKAFDAAMNLRYTKLGREPVNLAMQAEQDELIDAGFAGVDLPLDEYRTPSLFKQALAEYNKCWQREPWQVLGVQVPVAVELGFIYPLNAFWARIHEGCKHVDFVDPLMPEYRQCRLCDGKEHVNSSGRYARTYEKRIRVIMQGILDKLIRDNEGHVLVADTKTMNSYSDRTVTQWENASQPKAYAWCLQELARLNPDAGLPERVHGFLLNAVVIRKPYVEGRAIPKNAQPRFEFHRPRFFYTPEMLAECRQHTLDWIGMALQWVANDRFPMNEGSCANHYGKPCPYLPVCQTRAEQREDVLGSDLFKDYSRGPQWLAAQAEKQLTERNT